MKLELSEAKLINIIKEELDNFLYDEDEETPRYYLDINYYHIDDIPADQFHPNYPKGSSYGDMGYYFDDMWEYGMDSFEEAKEAARNMILDPGCGIARTEEEPNPAVVSVIYTTPYTPDAKSLFSVANCSQELAQELGIKADEYIETLNKEENIDNMAQNISESRLVNLLASILKENLDDIKARQTNRDFVTNSDYNKAIERIANTMDYAVVGYKQDEGTFTFVLGSKNGNIAKPEDIERIQNILTTRLKDDKVLVSQRQESIYVKIITPYNRQYKAEMNKSSDFVGSQWNSETPWNVHKPEVVKEGRNFDKIINESVSDVLSRFVQKTGSGVKNLGNTISDTFSDLYSGYKIRPEEQVTNIAQALENAGWRVTKKIGEGEYIIRKITGAFANTDRNESINGALQAINYFCEKQGSPLRAYVVKTNGGDDPSMAKILIK